MTQITERPAGQVAASDSSSQCLLAEIDSTIRSMKTSDTGTGAELLTKLALLVSDPYADRAAVTALFYRGNAGGRDTLGSLFYGFSDTVDDDDPIVAPSTSRVQNVAYRTGMNKLLAALNAVIPAENAPLAEKRSFWEGVKTHLAPGQMMNDGQVSEVTSADLNTVLKSYYGVNRAKGLKAFTDSPEALNFVLFNPRTVEGTKLEIRSSFRLNGEEPPVGAFSLRTMNGIIHFV